MEYLLSNPFVSAGHYADESCRTFLCEPKNNFLVDDADKLSIAFAESNECCLLTELCPGSIWRVTGLK